MDMSDTHTAIPPANQTYFQRLKQGEHLGIWKLSLRVVVCILDIIGIGCAAWALSNSLSFEVNPYIGYFESAGVAPFVITVCSVSFIFCLVCILVLLLRKPPRPVHPGVAVGCDLILWLAFIVTALFTTAASFSLAYFANSRDYLDDPSYGGEYSGEYYLADNGTWVYNITNVYTDSSSSTGYGDYFYNYTRHDYQLNTTLPKTSSVDRDCTPYFDNCLDQDRYINKLWSSRKQRFATEIVSGAVQWLAMLLHFILFVWACVDTNRRNRRTKVKKEGAVADRVIRDMQARGLITVHGPGGRDGPEGQALMTPASNGERG